MSNKSPKGASNIHPNKAPAPTGSEGTGSSLAAVPVVDDTSAALAAFETALKPILDALAPSISRPRVGSKVLVVQPKNETVAAQVAELARRHPELTSAGDPGIIEAGLSALTAARVVSAQLDVARREVGDTGRMAFATGWAVAHSIMLYAAHLAKDDKTLAEELAAIRAPLRKGSRIAAAERVATKAAQRVAVAQAHVAKEQQNAAAASQTAAAMAAAHAARHPAPPDVVNAPVTPPGKPPAR